MTEALYPSDLVTKVSQIEKNKELYTIRVRFPNEVFDCLLCLKASSLTSTSMLQHVHGKKHLNKLTNKYEFNRLINYHNVFSSLAEEYQIHQVLFKPGYKFPFIFCKICHIPIDGTEILNHIENNAHKESLKSCQKGVLFFEISSLNTSKKTSEALIANQDYQSYKLVVENPQFLKDDVSDDLDELSTSSSEPDIQEILKQWTSKMSTNSSIIFSNSALVKKDSIIITSTTDETSSTVIAKIDKKKIKSSSKKSTPLTKICTHNVITDGDTVTASTSESTPSTSSQENGLSNDSKKSAVKTQQPLKHNVIPAFKLNPQNMFDLLENRLQIDLEFINELEITNKEVKLHCTLCSQVFPKNERSIKIHITSRAHKKNAKGVIGGPEYIYYCDLCLKNIHGECKWEGHLISGEHRQR